MLVTRKNHIKIESLKLKNDISKVFKNGKTRTYDGIVIKKLDNSLSFNRLCIIPSHGFGNAVERNTLKRRVRNIIRETADSFILFYDIIIIVKKEEKNTDYKNLLIKINKVLKGLHMINTGEINRL